MPPGDTEIYPKTYEYRSRSFRLLAHREQLSPREVSRVHPNV